MSTHTAGQQRRKKNDQAVAVVALVVPPRPVWIGLGVRLIAATVLPWALDDGRMIPGVAYTDVDYHVFMDAARHIQNGGNPYDRTTYRYTPFLAQLLSYISMILPAGVPMHYNAGRYLFCVADAACGWIILGLRRRERKKNSNVAAHRRQRPPTRRPDYSDVVDALWWLYNPLAINICTRGSAESLQVLLPVLLTIWLVHGRRPSWQRALAAGVCHGVAAHAKLYPVIYTLSYVMALAAARDGWPSPPTSSPTRPARNGNSKNGVHHDMRVTTMSTLQILVHRLLRPLPVIFALSAMSTFVSLMVAAVRLYGSRALEEGLLYHFSRVDHRHNYSMHWYWIYLQRAAAAAAGQNDNDGWSTALAGRLLLVPQIMLLLVSSIGMAPANLSLALFVQTFLFVAHNKVITAQYFTWFLCLLPLCTASLAMTHRVGRALVMLVGSIVVWLATAYCLEMQGMAMHRLNWLASMAFFTANVNFLGAVLASSKTVSRRRKTD